MFLNVFTRENITLVLAIIGSIGTVITVATTFIYNHKNIKLHILAYSYDRRFYIFYMMFENRSRLPISINQLSIVTADKTCRCVLIPKMTMESTRHRGSEVVRRREYNSESFPINLTGLSSHSGLILFEPFEPLLTEASKSATFEVCTNRGKAEKIELSLVDLPNPFQMFR